MSPPESGFDPSRTPPVPPPPGVITNFTDPDSLSATSLAINVIFLAIAGVFVILRFYTRACITRRVGWDDYMVPPGLCFCASSIVLSQLSTNYGIGRHVWDVPLILLYPMGMKLFVWGVTKYCAGILFIKMSLLALYHQSFALPPAWFRVQWWTVLVITVGYSISGICYMHCRCFQSHPDLQDPVGKGVDFTRGIAWSGIWSNIEMSCAIVCTSAVTLRPLVRKHFSSWVPAQLRSNQVNLTSPHYVVYSSGGFGAPSHLRTTRAGSVELGARKKSEDNDSRDEVAQCPRETSLRGQVGIARCKRFMFPRRCCRQIGFLFTGRILWGDGGPRDVGRR
ncbi:hypothetical protein B0T18DRAFT_54677 [Schizothecium vesticola]|uniref:Rhodopsin domain-containing protein n=1 Tax=Schizothecium vesticola TaxID=314040 RepID=A0AA40K9A3_9PEZI|nr:hypothetical protein B0T18DRAFT_54677 [Schizothecium vesticola]